MTPPSQPNKGDLEYGSILPNGEDWRLRKFDAGMGETEYRIFKNGVFFAQFDNRKDADTIMELMTIPHSSAPAEQEIREKVLDDLTKRINEVDHYDEPTAYEDRDQANFEDGRSCAYTFILRCIAELRTPTPEAHKIRRHS